MFFFCFVYCICTCNFAHVKVEICISLDKLKPIINHDWIYSTLFEMVVVTLWQINIPISIIIGHIKMFFWPHLNPAIDLVMYLKSISEFSPGQLDRGERGYRPAMTDLTLVKLLSEGELAQIPRALALFQPSVRNLERALKERKPTPSPPSSPLSRA